MASQSPVSRGNIDDANIFHITQFLRVLINNAAHPGNVVAIDREMLDSDSLAIVVWRRASAEVGVCLTHVY